MEIPLDAEEQQQILISLYRELGLTEVIILMRQSFKKKLIWSR